MTPCRADLIFHVGFAEKSGAGANEDAGAGVGAGAGPGGGL